MIVQINPLFRDEVPTSARDILNRINEMTFNASLVREMAGIATITSLVESGALNDDRYTAVRFHQISAEDGAGEISAPLSKMNTERAFLEHLAPIGLRDRGQAGSPKTSSASAGKARSTCWRSIRSWRKREV